MLSLSHILNLIKLNIEDALLLTVKKEHGSTAEKREQRSHLPGLLKRIDDSHYSLHPYQKMAGQLGKLYSIMMLENWI